MEKFKSTKRKITQNEELIEFLEKIEIRDK